MSGMMRRDAGSVYCRRQQHGRPTTRSGPSLAQAPRPQHMRVALQPLISRSAAFSPCACLRPSDTPEVRSDTPTSRAALLQDATRVTSTSQASNNSGPNRLQRSANNILQFASSRLRRLDPSAPSNSDSASGNSLPIADRSSAYIRTTSEVLSHTYDAHHDRVTFPPSSSAQNPTLQLLLQRWRARSLPGQRTDGFKLGLAVEGGGMRGIISGAMLTWLERHGFRNAFDAVYGSSAGAINSTYFLTGQPAGLDVYIDYLASGNSFLNYSSALRGRPIMSLDYLVDQVMSHDIKLDWQGVLDSPIPLKCVVSCLDSLKSEVIGNYRSKDELALALKASATVPGFAGPPRIVRGQRMVDAAIFEPVPMDSAIADGCTHVLVLCTRPRDTRPVSVWRKRFNRGVENALRQTMLRQPYMTEALKIDVSVCEERTDNVLNFAAHGDPHALADTCGAYILPVQPATTGGCHPLCTDAKTLQAGIHEGNMAVARMLTGMTAHAPTFDATLSDLERGLELFRNEVQLSALRSPSHMRPLRGG